MRRFCTIPALATTLYAAGVVLFFIPSAAVAYKIAFPVLLLAVSVRLMRRRELLPFCCAFLFSAAGDAAGAQRLFILQMALFALAHIAYMVWFLPRARRRPRPAALAVVVPLLVFLFAVIVPHAAIPAERTGAALYGVVIASMLYSALQYDGPCAAGFRCAALLFIFSDALIAWNRFVAPVPSRTCAVMITYYLAQWLFFRFALKSTLKARALPPAAES